MGPTGVVVLVLVELELLTLAVEVLEVFKVVTVGVAVGAEPVVRVVPVVPAGVLLR